MWGAISPTKATAPRTDTTAATIRVVRVSSTPRQNTGSSPRLRACSSPRESIRTGRRSRSSATVHRTTAAAGRGSLSAVMAERLPMVHTSMAASSRSGSAITFRVMSPASAREETMTPARR